MEASCKYDQVRIYIIVYNHDIIVIYSHVTSITVYCMLCHCCQSATKLADGVEFLRKRGRYKCRSSGHGHPSTHYYASMCRPQLVGELFHDVAIF